MARNRMIKVDFWTDEKILACSRDARLLFIGLWNHSTDAGIGKISNFELKAKIFPVDTDIDPIKDIPKLLDELFIQGLLKVSECGKYYKISNWDSHQKIQRPSHKEIEKYEHLTFSFREDSLSIHGTLNEDSMNTHSEVKRKEVKEKEKLKEIKLNKKKVQILETKQKFEQFYNNYPRKVRKQDALKGFKRLNKADKELIIKRTDAVWLPYWQTKYKKNGKWLSNEFIPHPATYINRRLFEDEPPIIDDPEAVERQTLKANEDRLIKEQREQEAYLRRAEALAPKTDEDFQDVKSSISEALKNLRTKHTQA